MKKEQYIHPSAVIMGDITLGKQVSIWPNAVVRGDMDAIKIGDWSNVQDGCVLHVETGLPLVIGSHVTIGHKAVLHSCTVGDNSLIGIGSIVLDGAEIGEGCLIAAGALVSPGKKIPPRSLVMGTPGRIIRQLTDDELQQQKAAPKGYWQLAQKAMEKEQE